MKTEEDAFAMVVDKYVNRVVDVIKPGDCKYVKAILKGYTIDDYDGDYVLAVQIEDMPKLELLHYSRVKQVFREFSVF